jgi:hypothetical protein
VRRNRENHGLCDNGDGNRSSSNKRERRSADPLEPARSRRDRDRDRDQDQDLKDQHRGHQEKKRRSHDKRSSTCRSSRSSSSSDHDRDNDTGIDDDERRQQKRRKSHNKKKERDRDETRRKDDGRLHDKKKKSSKTVSSKKSKTSKRRDRRRHGRIRRGDDSSSDGDCSSDSSDNSSLGDKDRRAPQSSQASSSTAMQFAIRVKELLQQFPDMGDQLLTMLLRMSSGTSFDLTQVQPHSLSLCLEKVFTTLGRYGVELDPSTQSWHWMPAAQSSAGSRAERQRMESALPKLVRQLLNDAGLTLGAMKKFEHQQQQKKKEMDQELNWRQQQQDQAEEKEASRKRQERLDNKAREQEQQHNNDPKTQQVLELLRAIVAEFGGGNDIAPQASISLSLPQEMTGLISTLLEGEVVILEGLPNRALRERLETLFETMGLTPEALEAESDSDSDNEGKESSPMMGYALPEDDNNKNEMFVVSSSKQVQVLLQTAQQECERLSKPNADPGNTTRGNAVPKKKVIGPSFPPPTNNDAKLVSAFDLDAGEASCSDDSDGPAPAGSESDLHRRRRKVSKEEARRLAKHRQLEMDVATGKLSASDIQSSMNGREDWMMTPGEHTFLEGIIKGDPTKGRTFKNEKARGGEDATAMAPSVQREIQELQQSHAEAGGRGPSLMDLHRDKRAQEQMEESSNRGPNGNKEKWKWNRNKDIDDGRRVDKNALSMIMGGASENLGTKFARGFN